MLINYYYVCILSQIKTRIENTLTNNGVGIFVSRVELKQTPSKTLVRWMLLSLSNMKVKMD